MKRSLIAASVLSAVFMSAGVLLLMSMIQAF